MDIGLAVEQIHHGLLEAVALLVTDKTRVMTVRTGIGQIQIIRRISGLGHEKQLLVLKFLKVLLHILYNILLTQDGRAGSVSTESSRFFLKLPISR